MFISLGFLLRHPVFSWGYFRRFKILQQLVGYTREMTENRKRYEEEFRRAYFLLQSKANKYPGVWQSSLLLDPLAVEILYFIVRLLKPKIVVETGVGNGATTSIVLAAMDMNKEGRLYSIDLPDDLIPSTVLCPSKSVGWMIPEPFERRWCLLRGNVKQVLPELLKDLPPIDIFLHDSDHSYENIMFESRTIWPFLRKGGVLLADDWYFNSALQDFARETRIRLVAFLRIAGLRKT